MSHFTLTVVVPKEQVHRLRAYLDEVLLPYDENLVTEPRTIHLTAEDIEAMKSFYETEDEAELAAKMQAWMGMPGGIDGECLFYITTRNAQKKWDWWKVGGRWRGYFKAKTNMPYIVGDASWSEDESPPTGWGDIIRLGDVDWDGMREGLIEDARKEWATTDHVLLDTTATTEEEYVAEFSSISSFALVDKEGEWHESGSMGWWGIVRDEKDNLAWAEEWRAYIDSCHFEDMLVNIDAHI